MRYDLTQVLCDHRGRAITEPKTDDDGSVHTEVVTLGTALERAAIGGGNPQDSLERKHAQYKLARKLTGASAELTTEEVSLLKKLAAQVFSPIATGAVVEALENPVVQIDNDAHA